MLLTTAMTLRSPLLPPAAHCILLSSPSQCSRAPSIKSEFCKGQQVYGTDASVAGSYDRGKGRLYRKLCHLNLKGRGLLNSEFIRH